MIKLIDPIEHLLNCIKKKYPNLKCLIQFDSDYQKNNNSESFANTCFPDDGSEPVITIDGTVPYSASLELISHEIAHVICHQELNQDLTKCSEEEAHSSVFKKEFEELHLLYSSTYKNYVDSFYL